MLGLGAFEFEAFNGLGVWGSGFRSFRTQEAFNFGLVPFHPFFGDEGLAIGTPCLRDQGDFRNSGVSELEV